MKRSPLRKSSSKRAAEQRRYSKLRKQWLIDNPWCFACRGTYCDWKADWRQATEVHHYRGKLGRLLCDTRFFRSVCSEHHNYIHHVNPNEARRMGWLAPAAEFGLYPA